MTPINSLLSIASILAGLFQPTPEANPLPVPLPPVERSVCEIHDCRLSDAGETLIKQFEGYSPFIYLDSAGLPTIGHGHLILKGEKIQEPLMLDAAAELLRKDTQRIQSGVRRITVGPLKQQRYDALVSFTFNLGVGSYQESTLRKRVNAKQHDLVPAEFRKWIYVTKNGKKIKINGLILRREAEARLYSGD